MRGLNKKLQGGVLKKSTIPLIKLAFLGGKKTQGYILKALGPLSLIFQIEKFTGYFKTTKLCINILRSEFNRKEPLQPPKKPLLQRQSPLTAVAATRTVPQNQQMA